MEKANIILEDGSLKQVDCLFYLYDFKYYFIYTEKEIDSNGYVVLYVVQVGKEVKQTPNGPVETGFLIGVNIDDANENNGVQASITKIVEDKKSGTTSSDISYIPVSQISNLKISSKKTFRLLKSIVENYFNLSFESQVPEQTIDEPTNQQEPVNNTVDNNVIVDYRSKYFEQQDKIQELENRISEMESKFNNIKQIIG